MSLPPYADFLQLTVAENGVLVMPFGRHVLGRPGFVHGGALGGLLEMAAWVALHRALEHDRARIKPINLTVDFMRGAREHATFARATISRLGTRVANLEAVAWQDDPARPVAGGRLNYLLVRDTPSAA